MGTDSTPPNTHTGTTHLTVIRHGETDWNQQARMQGHADVALNATGLAQARQVASALAHWPLHALYSSDLSRALHTAQAIAERHPTIPLHTEPALRERHYGAFQGKTLAEVTPIDPQGAARWRARDPRFAPAGGEDLIAFTQRVRHAFARMAAQHCGQHIVVVTHGGVLDVLWRLVHDLPVDTPRAWPLPNTGINQLRCISGPAGLQWQIDSWANTSHLQQQDAVRDETIA